MGSIEMPWGNDNGESQSFDGVDVDAAENVGAPMEVGTRIMCRWKDDKYHPVKVIERRKVPNADYVHYSELNRRVRLEQLDLDSVEGVVDQRIEEKGAIGRLQQDTPREEEDRSDACRGTS